MEKSKAGGNGGPGLAYYFKKSDLGRLFGEISSWQRPKVGNGVNYLSGESMFQTEGRAPAKAWRKKGTCYVTGGSHRDWGRENKRESGRRWGKLSKGCWDHAESWK